MAQTDNRMQTYWPQVREFIKAEWPQFTEVELKKIDGDYDKFANYYNDLYNDFPLGEAVARDKLQKFFNKLDDELFV